MNKFIFLIFCIYAFHVTPAFAYNASDIPRIERTWDSSPNYSETKVLKIINDKNLSNQIPLTLLILKDSGWTLDEVMAKFTRTAEIYGSQCDIHFNPVMILESKNINGPTFDYKNPWPHVAYLELEEMNVLKKPLVYFAKNEVKNKGYGGFAWGRDSKGGKEYKEARDSAFLFRNLALKVDFSSSKINGDELDRYEILAHELAHILMVLPELSEGHFLISEGHARTNVISSSQCELIRKNFLIK